MFRRTLTACVMGALFVAAICTLRWPMGRDQGVFAWAGDVIVHGGTPYRDAWEVKGPAAHYTYAAAILLFGPNQWGIRLLDLVFVAFGIAALWRLTRNLHSRFAANLAVALFLIWYWSLGYWGTAQPDGWIAIVELVAMMLLVGADGSRRWRNITIASMLFCVAVLYKPMYGLYWVALLPAIMARSAASGSRLRILCGAVVGGALPLIAVAAWLAHRGALHDLIQIQFVFNPLVYAAAHQKLLWSHANDSYLYWAAKGIIFLIAMSFIGAQRLWRLNRNAFYTLGLFLVVDLICIVVQNKYYGYHWTPLLAPLALYAALGTAAVKEAIDQLPPSPATAQPTGFLRSTARGILVLALAWMAVPMLAHTAPVLASLLRLRSWPAYYSGIQYPSFSSETKVGDYLRQHTSSDDKVLVWGFDPLINYLADRRSPTRFGYNYPLTRGPSNPFEEKWRAEFMHDLRARPPAYIVVAARDTNNLTSQTSTESMADFREFDAYVRGNFEIAATIEDYTLWRRNGLPSAPGDPS